MAYTTIDNDDQPWVICLPTDQADLDRFLNISQSEAIGSGLNPRPATRAEARKCSAERALGRMRGDNPHKFFGIPA